MAQRIGVCSWSLQPGGPADLAAKVRACGVGAVQLALDPLRDGRWDEGQTVAALRESGVGILSGMMAMRGEDYSSIDSIRATGGVRSDEHWPVNRGATAANADLASRLGIGLVTFHAGFLPEEQDDPLRAVMVERLREVCGAFAERSVRVAFETGQETPETLLEVLGRLDDLGVGVNFDPANMILYGTGDPIEALRVLAPHVLQIHIKDAVPSGTPGQWGREVPAGEGAVDWSALFEIVRAASLDVPLVIEREAGGSRTGDVVKARDLVRYYAGSGVNS